MPESRLLKLNDANLERQKQLMATQKAKEAAEAAALAGKDASTSAPTKKKAPADGASRGVKRGRESMAAAVMDTEEDWQRRPEIKLSIPEALKIQLVDDWEAVTKNASVSKACLAHAVGLIKRNRSCLCLDHRTCKKS